MKKIILLLLFGFTYTYAQNVKVIKTELLTGNLHEEYYHPHFTADDSAIIITKSNYKGLYELNLNNKSLKELTSEFGAGYKPLVLNEEKIIYRPFKVKEGRKYNLLKSIDFKKKKIEVIENEQRKLSLPNQTGGDRIIYRTGKELKAIPSEGNGLAKNAKQNIAVYSENNSLYLLQNNIVKELSPLGKGVYVWESLSRDATKILFTFGNKGTFVSDLKGNIILQIEDAHYPKFSPNGKYISYMIDKDNGYNYTSSEIYVYSIDEKKSYRITDTKDKIEMFAEWSNDGKKLVYNTTGGEIYLVKLEIKN